MRKEAKLSLFADVILYTRTRKIDKSQLGREV